MATEIVSARELIQAGVHFGHRTSRWNPKMQQYIFDKRNSVHIIDIRETLKGLINAYYFLRSIVGRGEDVLFVGTKRQAKSVVEREARRCGMHWVSERWLGGCLTNYTTIRKRLKRLIEIEDLEETGKIHQYVKKEISSIMREKRKLITNLDGVRNMEKLPKAIVVVDPNFEKIAIAEAHKIGATVIALIDTDGDPSNIDIAIPGNDDSMRVVQLVLSKLADAIEEGRVKAIANQRKVDAARKEQVVRETKVREARADERKKREENQRIIEEARRKHLEAKKKADGSPEEVADEAPAAAAVTAGDPATEEPKTEEKE
jgi:small subunit ribosomal protein S2